MPELPEVETVRRGLEKEIEGLRIEAVKLHRKDIRTPFPPRFTERLKDAVIKQVKRRAKYLLLELDSEETLIIHLGMSGRLLVREQGKFAHQKHDHVEMKLSKGKELVFNDARRFGLMDIAETAEIKSHSLFTHLGPEPLEKAFSPAYLAQQLSRRNVAIKPVLMIQEVVVGVGNIYASEALFRVGIHPETQAKDCAEKSAEIIEAIRIVLKDAIKSGGSTLRNYARESGEIGYFQHHFQVYGRTGKPCYVCKNNILQIVQAGRSSFFCPHCQPKKGNPLKRKAKK